jgi:hypothetical protein
MQFVPDWKTNNGNTLAWYTFQICGKNKTNFTTC